MWYSLLMFMWKYYWSFLCEILPLWKNAKAKRATVVAAMPLLAYLLPFLPQPWASSLVEYWKGLPHWLPVVPLVALVLYGLLKINYGKYAAVEKRAEKVEREIIELQTPRFKILFGQGPPFEQMDIWANSEEVQWRWFRIGVKNTSMMTIDDVVVRLEEMFDLSASPPGKSPVPPIVLRQMNDDPIDGQYRQSFTLHPGSTQFIEVVWKPEADLTSDTDEIRLGYAQSARAYIQCWRHALLIQVTGRNAPTEPGWFFVDVDANGRLLFGPMEGPHE